MCHWGSEEGKKGFTFAAIFASSKWEDPTLPLLSNMITTSKNLLFTLLLWWLPDPVPLPDPIPLPDPVPLPDPIPLGNETVGGLAGGLHLPGTNEAPGAGVLHLIGANVAPGAGVGIGNRRLSSS